MALWIDIGYGAAELRTRAGLRMEVGGSGHERQGKSIPIAGGILSVDHYGVSTHTFGKLC
jgi:hypothetical protein